MEEENKRIRDEIDSMERRLLSCYLSPLNYHNLMIYSYDEIIIMIMFRYDRIAEFARSHGLDVAVEPHQVKLPFSNLPHPDIGISRWAKLPVLSILKPSKIFSSVSSKAKWLLNPAVNFVSSYICNRHSVPVQILTRQANFVESRDDLTPR